MKNLNLFMFLALFLINMSCSEKEEPINDEEASEIVKDIDGNEYEVLNLLGRKWLRQDLKTSRYRDGTVIPRVEDSEEWESMSEGAYTWYNNDPKNDKEFGKIYNGYAIICCEICPDGWRLPTENEIRIVSGYFARYYDLQQYPMVPEWMNLEGLIGGERNPNGEFVNERNL